VNLQNKAQTEWEKFKEKKMEEVSVLGRKSYGPETDTKT
jgi:hypothetical protein